MATIAPPAPNEHRKRALPEMSHTFSVPSAAPVEHQPLSAKATLTTAAPDSSSSDVGACSKRQSTFLDEQWITAAQPSSAPPITKSGSEG